MAGDSTWWRAGMFTFEHELPLLVSADGTRPLRHCGGRLRRVGEDTTLSVYYDSPDRDMERRGVKLSVYGYPSNPAFGVKLRMKEWLSFTDRVRHSFSVTVPLTAALAGLAVGGLAPLRGLQPAAAALRHVPGPVEILPVAHLLQERTRYVYQHEEDQEYLSVSLDECIFTGSGGTLTATFLEISTYSWPLSRLDILAATDEMTAENEDRLEVTAAVPSKYDHFRLLQEQKAS
ncbi:hypothetical protein AAH991_38300 [Microbispora sp. ZYX-F-249]|uniref:Uncharacterized protein n=1 Tax=Microbispora maris TaxID=3144104 RepID=A0ABV0B0H2_9ACTN